MDIVNDAKFRTVSKSLCGDERDNCRTIYRDSQYLMHQAKTTLVVWFEGESTTRIGDTSPVQAHSDNVNRKGSTRKDSQILNGAADYPRVLVGPSVQSDDRSCVYDSIIILPFGSLKSDNCIKSCEVYRGESRYIIACVLSTHRLIVFSSDQMTCVISGYPKRLFNIDNIIPATALVSPGTVHILEESILVTDNKSSSVLEIRFDHSLSMGQKSSPETSIANWYLESGIAIGPSTRVSLVGEPHILKLQVIGISNNGESQGVVRLLNQKPYILSRTCSVPVTIRHINDNTIVSNTSTWFKILSTDHGFDFPLYISPPVVSYSTTNAGSVYVLRSFGAVEVIANGKREIAHHVHAFAVSKSGDFLVSQLIGSDTVDIFRVSHELTRIKSIIGFPQLRRLCINDNADWVGLSDDGNVVGSLISTPHNGSCDVALCNEWLVRATHDGQICISPVHDMKILHVIDVSCVAGEIQSGQLDFFAIPIKTRHGVYISGIPGHTIVLKRDFHKGISWSLVDMGIRSSAAVVTITAEHMYSLDTVPPHRLSLSSIDDRLRCLLYPEKIKPVLESFVACLDGVETVIDDEKLRLRIEPLLETCDGGISSTVSRSCDYPSRQYLIEWYFTQYVDEIRLTTKSICWAAVSETQSYIVDGIKAHGTPLTWELIRSSGVAVWCTELSMIRDLADCMQKLALQEYMKSRDVTILDTKVVVWLAGIGGKQSLISALYKQHATSCASPVHIRVSEFFQSNFTVPENSTKAIKNAFELLNQKRFHMAVTVFWLAGSYREAVDVCCRQIGDVQLALFMLKLLKICGKPELVSVADELIENVWTSRLNQEDAWIQMVYAYTKSHYSMAVQLFATTTMPTSILPFISMSPRLTYPSYRRFMQIFRERLKRLNRPITDEDIVHSSDQEDICIYMERGLFSLARSRLDMASNVSDSLRRSVLANCDS